MTGARGAAGLGVALCLVAGAFAATPLFVPGLALLLSVTVGGVWVSLAARGATVVRAIERPAVEEDVPLRVRVLVTRSRMPLPAGELRACEDGAMLPVPRTGDHEVSTPVRLARRGRHLLPPASLAITDPLGLWQRTVCSGADEVLVLPRVEPVERLEPAGSPGHWPDLGRGLGAGRPDAGATDVDSLQPHQPGTPASRIHWPSVARTGTLMERRLIADVDRPPTVVVDPRAPASDDALDQAVRAAASVCAHLARRGGCALLLPGDRRTLAIDAELHGFGEAHARLALVTPGAEGPPAVALAGAGAVLWVTAAPAPHGLPGSVRYLITPHRERRWPARFAVAGCHGYELAHGDMWSVAV